MNKEHNYRAGSRITYRPFGGGIRIVVVEEREDDIKNGRPGFVGKTTSGEDVWGYDDQIIGVAVF
jgi:hypothetical protein